MTLELRPGGGQEKYSSRENNFFSFYTWFSNLYRAERTVCVDLFTLHGSSGSALALTNTTSNSYDKYYIQRRVFTKHSGRS